MQCKNNVIDYKYKKKIPRKIKSKRREKERENTCKLELIRINRDQLITNTSTNGTHDGRWVRSVKLSWHHKNYQRISESNPVWDSPVHSQNPCIQPHTHTNKQTQREAKEKNMFACVCVCVCALERIMCCLGALERE